ncbi:MAG: alanine/glycine:cation symporter family protein [bacterium]|jgi:AGCS family alanine or glycine:cation symporter
MLDILQVVVSMVSNFFWSGPLLFGILGIGLYYSVMMKFDQWTKFGFHIKNTYATMFDKAGEGEGTVRGFAAAATAIASTIGVGNIGGAAVAITMGGPGAIFWMWMTAFLGASTKAAEIILGQRYRVKFETIDEYICGRQYVMKNALGWGKLASALCWTVIISPWSIQVQTNAIARSIETAFNIHVNIGIALVMITLGLTVAGGLRRIASVADKVVPFMAVFFIIAAAILLSKRADRILPALGLIVKCGFTPAAPVGGFMGATMRQAMRFGVARGVYSNEAGMGGGMRSHAAAIVDHPVRQASWGFGEVFIDTIVICTLVALTILTTDAHILNPGVTSAQLTTIAFMDVLGPFGGYLIAISTFLFGWTTLLSSYYGGEKSVNFLCGDTSLNKIMTKVWMVYYIGPMVFAGMSTGLLWLISDTMQVIGVSSVILTLFMTRREVMRLHSDFWNRYLPELEAGRHPPVVSFSNKP